MATHNPLPIPPRDSTDVEAGKIMSARAKAGIKVTDPANRPNRLGTPGFKVSGGGRIGGGSQTAPPDNPS